MNPQSQADASVVPVRAFSAIWFLPLIAILIGAWMVYYQWYNQGPIVTIHFTSAEGLEVGKTKLKSRNVNIGEVESISLNDSVDGVVVTARMSKSAEKLLVEDTQFWIVSPRISLAGVSGLNTLISGVYIELAQGTSKEDRLEFEALKEPPVTPKGTPGLRITLNSNDQFAYAKGDPIIYKGLTVGQFEDVYFNFEERVVYYNAFIKAPYHKLVTSNTKFWDASGLSVGLSADGVSVKTGNLETMLTNGVTFDVPKGMLIGEQITERAYFDIYANYELASDQRYKHSLQYVVLVSDTIRGLNVGAPVEYRGVLLGHVASTNMLSKAASDFFTDAVKIPVLINLQPGRVGLPDDKSGVQKMDEQNRYWVRQGLKATLKTGNLLTGSLFVELQHFEGQQVGEIESFEGYPIIPTSGDQFTQIAGKIGQFVDTLNSLPLVDFTESANTTLTNVSALSEDLQGVSKHLEELLASANQQALAETLRQSLEKVTTLSEGFSEGSPGYEQLQRAMESMSDVMGELKPLLNQLKHQPNGLIFNAGQSDPVEPTKHSGAK